MVAAHYSSKEAVKCSILPLRSERVFQELLCIGRRDGNFVAMFADAGCTFSSALAPYCQQPLGLRPQRDTGANW